MSLEVYIAPYRKSACESPYALFRAVGPSSATSVWPSSHSFHAIVSVFAAGHRQACHALQYGPAFHPYVSGIAMDVAARSRSGLASDAGWTGSLRIVKTEAGIPVERT